MSQKTNVKQTRPVNSTRKTPRTPRTPRTLMLEDNPVNKKPQVLSETFNLKNFDLIGKVDDMRVLTKELAVMARQLEQWVSIAYTISMAFKDNGVLKDLLKAVTSVNSFGNEQEHHRENEGQPFSLPFSFMQNQPGPNQRDSSRAQNSSNNNMSLLEILNNPAFKEIMSKLFQQNK